MREDPERKGLLFAGTERAVHVSFDDGEHWQSLRLNMGATSIRDLIVKGDDLCVGTHGRGFWILDNITPLRQLQDSITKSAAFLFKPQTAWRVRWNTNTDTPLPPDVAAGENPPDGAMIDYYIGTSTAGPVTLEIKDVRGTTVRRYSSDDPLPPPRSNAQHSALLDTAAAAAGESTGPASLSLGSALRARARRPAPVSNRRGLQKHGDCAHVALGDAGDVHGCAHGCGKEI